MNASLTLRKLALAMLVVVAILSTQGLRVESVLASPPQGPWQPSGFQGAWCAQGDSTKHCSITANGPFLNLTNETGSTSTAHFIGMNNNVITADQWQFVQGTLSSDATRIDWSNGTYWARCPSGGGGGNWWRYPNVDGTWYRGGDHSQSCYIRQHRKNLNLTNESGQRGAAARMAAGTSPRTGMAPRSTAASVPTATRFIGITVRPGRGREQRGL